MRGGFYVIWKWQEDDRPTKFRETVSASERLSTEKIVQCRRGGFPLRLEREAGPTRRHGNQGHVEGTPVRAEKVRLFW